MTSPKEQQTVQVRIYQTDQHIMLAAPMAGLEPPNIFVKIDGDRVTIRGDARGPSKEWRELLVAEWSIGPYYREVTLPIPVNGVLSNATYGNGLLVLSMPKTKPGQQGEPAEFVLEPLEPPRGERVGHTGNDIRRITTLEHRRLREQTVRGADRKKTAAPA